MRNRPTLQILYCTNSTEMNEIKFELMPKRPISKNYFKNIRIIYKNVANNQQMNRRNDTFKIKDRLSTNAIEICEHFHEFLINVGPTLSKNIPLQDFSASDLIERLEHTLYLFPTALGGMIYLPMF